MIPSFWHRNFNFRQHEMVSAHSVFIFIAFVKHFTIVEFHAHGVALFLISGLEHGNSVHFVEDRLVSFFSCVYVIIF